MMGQLTQEQINVDLFDEVKRLQAELAEAKETIDLLRMAELGNEKINQRIDKHAVETNRKYLTEVDKNKQLTERVAVLEEVLGCLIAVLDLTWSESDKLIPEYVEAKKALEDSL